MHISHLFAVFFWDPPREAVTLPLIDHPIVWYGVFFVVGLIVGYSMMFRLMTRHFQLTCGWTAQKAKNVAAPLIDRCCWFIVAGTLIGARFGHIFFYEWPYYRENLWRVFQTWKGGLASHGAGVGILIALTLYYRWVKKRQPSLHFLTLLDMLVIPTAFAGFCIRVGNFFNQELIGSITRVPWAVIFGSPADGSFPAPRHPVQLYEAVTYLGIFAILLPLWLKTPLRRREGFMSGLFLVLVFTGRIICEFFKETVSTSWNLPAPFQTGQWLSIPYVMGGIVLILYSLREAKTSSIEAPM